MTSVAGPHARVRPDPRAAPAVLRRRRTSVRLRLAFAHAALLGALVLALAGAGVWYVQRALRAQVDAELVETARLLATALARGAAATAPDAVHREAVRALRAGHLDVLVFDPSGRRVVSRTTPAADGLDSTTWPTLLAAALAEGARVDLAVFTLRVPGEPERRAAALPLARVAVGVPNAAGDLLLVAVRDLADVRAVIAALWTALAVALPVALLLALVLGYWLARRGLAPVGAMSAQAARIGVSTPDARLVPRDPDDELGRMAAAFNALLDRLAAALEQQRQFMADASHELRTPAAVVRSAADVALRREDRSAAEYRQALEIARSEADRLARIVDDLFLLARADAAQPTLRLREFYLDEALAECARAMRALATERGVALETELVTGAAAAEDAGAPMVGDEALVRRLALNLLDNALKFTPRGGRVTLRLAPDSLARDAAERSTVSGGPAAVRAAWRLEVEDTGAGVPAEARARIFDRFYRADGARASGVGGAGLGLAMARTIAEAHGGRLELSRSDASGSLFVAVLPRGED